MTARVSLSCDGLIPDAGYPCRQATPVGSPRSGGVARQIANREHGWRVGLADTGQPWGETVAGPLLDLCPPCARRAEEHPERGIRLLPATGHPATTPADVSSVPKPRPEPEPLGCHTCGRRQDDHPFRHPFRAAGFGRPRQQEPRR